MWNEEDEDGLDVMRGLRNAFIILLLGLMIIGTIWRAITE